MTSVTIRVPRELVAVLREYAESEGITVSEAIRRAIIWRCRQ